MLDSRNLSVGSLVNRFPGKITATAIMVLGENVLMALIPLMIGLTIDGLLEGNSAMVWNTAGILFLLTLFAMGRRAFDTRAYGSIRVALADSLVKRSVALDVSTISARVDMSRELVDFLEEHVPELLAATVQLITAVFILTSFDMRMGAASAVAMLVMIGLYLLFNGRFYQGNLELNEQREKQVTLLKDRLSSSVLAHFRKLRRWEVHLSDSEALLYGLIFMVMSVFLLMNIVLSTELVDVTPGKIFVVVNYSWSFVEAAFLLPMSLQQWTRLNEITSRINDSN